METAADFKRWVRSSRRSGVFRATAGQVVRARVHDRTVFFSVINPKDTIQKCHFGGAFYEVEELGMISEHFPVGGSFLDIGANVGNHSLYLALFLHASLVVPVEPNPVAAEILVSNLHLNGMESKVDFNWVGYGVSNEARSDLGVSWNARNLGGGKLIEQQGSIPVVPAAELVKDRSFDFIKIDVEGMEIAVLESLLPSLGQNRPVIFVEVDDKNATEFHELIATNGYEVVDQFRRYRVNENFLIKPSEGPAKVAKSA
ncbi:FkbM family methyltransferase [Ruegeria arenilitoris]|uniref:FkbM family methyltransferase n=2 Tax=Ruegeria arenilitoris TaxID=1173585 RepID=UPI001CFF36C1|nr:FkbM family methyltransferase [Ruegeria arenilitoris]